MVYGGGYFTKVVKRNIDTGKNEAHWERSDKKTQDFLTLYRKTVSD